MSINQFGEISSRETSPVLLPSFSDKVHALVALRDEACLSPAQLQEVIEAMIDQAVRSNSALPPALLLIRLRADLQTNGISLAA